MNHMVKDPAMGVLGYEREELDFYPTPEWVTEVIVPEVSSRLVRDARGGELLPDTIWECACGDGAMSRVLKAGLDEAIGVGNVLESDIVDRGVGFQADFLGIKSLATSTLENPEYQLHNVRGIVTNPPYGDLAQQFVEKALHLMKPVQGFVCMIMRNEWDSAKERQKLIGLHPAFSKKIVLTTRPRWIANTTGSPRHNYAWFVWDWLDTRVPNFKPTIEYHIRSKKEK
jgi:hypothetical protein